MGRFRRAKAEFHRRECNPVPDALSVEMHNLASTIQTGVFQRGTDRDHGVLLTLNRDQAPCRLLCANSGHRAAYSITLFARARSVGGTASPIPSCEPSAGASAPPLAAASGGTPSQSMSVACSDEVTLRHRLFVP
jgi:hypothetical protein